VNGEQNEWFWGSWALEQAVLGQLVQNERFWGSRALERAVTAGWGVQDGLVYSGRVPERVVLALGLA
jgi:hypothetical protein